MIAIIRSEERKLNDSPLGLFAVGIGIHGFVGHPAQKLLFVPHFGWREQSWKERLEEAAGVPVWIDNEANLAALGELESGAAAERSDILYVSVGAGIGAGFILGGDVFRGSGGYAGEVGHTTIEREGLPCACGNNGCWELYASEKALAGLAGLPYEPGVTERLQERLRQGDPNALSAAREVGRNLGIGIGNLVQAFNPQMVVIGNAIAAYREWIEESVERALASRFPFSHIKTVDIRYSELGDKACAIGAAYTGIRSMMKR